MPRRRQPPSALRLMQGPLPPRTAPRHTLPSLPCPAFHPEASLPRGPAPSPRTRRADPARLAFPDLPPLDVEIATICRSASSTPTTLSSSPTSEKRIRGPWEHSGCISVQVDVDSLIAFPKPTAVSL
ncbi:hypothetical protein AZE42_02046 [Rhizopogon vesiculosus]|uniref:Uncharacterized protein n=1 Tax=Rhizopogon vesiculosus TaxID=180088 RepID=A0A1J8QRJ6_9AGAM|nr:hypothetical protein AZE42_02046 [Rhizopogon vesiculosus]